MKNFINTYWQKVLFFILVGLIGGYFVGIYSFESYPIEMQQQVISQGLDKNLLGLITAIQSAGYGLILGSLGILLSKKIGLWKDDIKFEKKSIVSSIIVAIIGGLSMILLDVFFFGNYSQAIVDSYLVKPTISYIIAMVTYGAVIEEIMLRLFMMSLIAFILHKIFERDKQYTSTLILILSNIISAMLFAAGHLPVTSILLGLSPMIIFRCFLLNGGLGLLFGRLYRKHGIWYAMIAHGGCHIISKLIWILFL